MRKAQLDPDKNEVEKNIENSSAESISARYNSVHVDVLSILYRIRILQLKNKININRKLYCSLILERVVYKRKSFDLTMVSKAKK